MDTITFPEIDGLIQAPCASGAMRYQLKGGEWVTVHPLIAVLHVVPGRRTDGIGVDVDDLSHDGTPGGIEAAVRLLLRFAA